jgi:hypothetical protein
MAHNDSTAPARQDLAPNSGEGSPSEALQGVNAQLRR